MVIMGIALVATTVINMRLAIVRRRGSGRPDLQEIMRALDANGDQKISIQVLPPPFFRGAYWG